MDVKYFTCLIILHCNLVFYVKGDVNGKGLQRRVVDNPYDRIKQKSFQNFNRLLELSTEHQNDDGKDYLLPPVLNHHEELDEDDDDDHEHSYLDYDYDSKETHYKDPPDSATARSNINHDALDDKLPVHSTSDNLPIFLLEPESTYVVKNKPATLKCRAANALEIYFKCNGIKNSAANFEFVDPQTGVRIVEGEHEITRENVEEYFGSDKYQCFCFAWTSRGHIRSQPATVEIAYIKKHFLFAPESKLVKQHAPVTFRCDPPPAAPFAQLYWFKNGAPLVVDNNVQITKEGNLVIQQASLLDIANYTCVAENLAGKRLSEPALLTVFVNGGWTTWSSWGECWCPGQTRESRETHTGRRRVRSCTAPRPMNGGQPCVGPSVQKTQDCLDCDLDMYVDGLDELTDDNSGIVLGRWSQWSEWSRCDSDCLQSRRRRCLSNTACLGKDYQMAQCPLCVRTSKFGLINNSSSYWPVFIAMAVSFLILIVVIILGVKYMKMRMTDSSLYVKPSPGSNYFGNVIKRTLTNQPDLTIHEEFQTVGSRNTQRQTYSSNNNIRNEHLYEVPQLTSYISPIDHEVRTDRNGSVRNHVTKDINMESEISDSSCFLSSGSSCGNDSVAMSPSLKNNTSIHSKFINNHTINNFDTTTSKIITKEGDWLNLDKCGVSLFVPDGVVDKTEELFSIEVTDVDWNRPMLQEGETLLSSVIRCDPKNYHFSKGVVISFPHWAALKNTSWLLSIFQKPEEINSREWRKVLTLGQETPGTPIFAQIDPGKVYLMCEFLSDFVLVGRSFSGLDAKLLKICVFISKRVDEEHLTLKVHVLNDTPHALQDCVETENSVGGSLLCEPKLLYFQENCSDICINIRDVGTGWRVHSSAYQEISYTLLWSMGCRSMHCAFILQQTDTINCFELNLFVYQKQKQSNSVNFNVKTSDLNFNLNQNKRFSSASVGTGYSVNVLENPFNYSSLSRKEGRYDFVHKYNNSSYKSDLSDNIRRINGLTKSDRIILCKLLDSETSKGNDWRLLAEKLRLTSYYYYFSNTCSPTENIINLWACRHNDVNMLSSLSRIFREMSRIDCATVVERRCFTN